MYNAKYVILGIIVFVAIFTTPFWIGGFEEYKALELAKPANNEKECIEPVEFMRAEHMQLLNEWRDEALRNENRVYVSSTGKKWEISLQNTCMKCHNNKVDFCDKCHISNSVYPYCWTCHIAPTANSNAAPTADGNVTPDVDSNVAPDVDSNVAPDVDSNVAPDVDSNVAPKGDSNEQ